MATQERVVQFIDRNVTRKDFSEMGDNLLISSIFYTIQGEGPYAGYPSVFIRFAGCNRGKKVDCPWCDTNFLMDKGKKYSIKKLVETVEEHKNPYSKDNPIVVITGGEPLLQRNLEGLVSALHDAGYVVQIETNGDLLRHDSVPRAVVVVSPKVSMRTRRYTNLPEGAMARADYLKFLVEDVKDSPYNRLPEYASKFADVKGSYNVLISPISEYARDIKPGETASMWSGLYSIEVAARNHPYAAKMALDKGFRVSMQTHLFLSVE